MKAFAIKNDEGKYRGNSYIGDVRDIRHAEIYDTLEEIILDDGEEVVEITIAEGDIEEENRVLKSNLYEIWHNFATICEVCVSESKYEISSENAVEEIRNYLSHIDLCFDEIEEKLGTDYFIKQAKGEKDER